MLLTISAKAFGTTTPGRAKGTVPITNGDFTIRSNGDLPRLTTGDGIDEATTWAFKLKQDTNWPSFDAANGLESAELVLTITPKNKLITTDVVYIKGLESIATSVIRSLPLDITQTITLDLLDEGYSADDVLKVLDDNNGKLPMVYADDAIISYAEIRLRQRVKKDCRLIVEAVSEDTIAAPGNKLDNYVLISVTDACGNPLTHLNASNFKIDPMVVGPGGALVDITSVTHSSRIDGFYFMDVKPINNYSWKAGVYVFAIAVKDKHRRGQTITKVKMD
jgi:hypothetical protein